MKTKLVYVLVSYDEQNDYLEQCLLSCYSARLHNADAEIILLVDNLTDNTLQGKRAEILKYISQKIDRLFIKTVKADVYIHKFFKQYKFDGQHYWEIGTREHTKRSVLKSMRKFFAVEKWYVAPFNPYHVFFILRKKV